MATNTQGRVARVFPEQEVHYLRKTVNYNDTGIATGVPFQAYLPAGAQILACYVNVLTVFNAGTTNVLTVGQNSSSYNDIVGTSDINEAATGMTQVLTGGALDITSDVLAYVKYAQTGGAATTGKARIVIAYVVDNDQ